MAVPEKNCCNFNFNLQLKCLFSSSGWPQAKSLKFEGQGEKSSWPHLSFLLSCPFFSSPILLTCFWPFQDLELEEGYSLIHKFLFDALEVITPSLAFADVGSWFLSRGTFMGSSETFPFPISVASRCPAAIHLQLSPHRPPRRPFLSGAKHHHLNSLSLRDFVLSIGNTICPGWLWECSYFPTPQSSRFQFLQREPVSRPVSFKCRRHTLNSADDSIKVLSFDLR